MILNYLRAQLLFWAAIGFAVGCRPSSILLIHMGKSDLKYCAINENTDLCIRDLESRSYVRADRLTPEERASLGIVIPY